MNMYGKQLSANKKMLENVSVVGYKTDVSVFLLNASVLLSFVAIFNFLFERNETREAANEAWSALKNGVKSAFFSRIASKNIVLQRLLSD